MEFELVKLYFSDSLHAGATGIGVEKAEKIIHSDTLFSAICNSWAILYGKDEVEDLINCFREAEPPFVISSAFPFTEDKLFFPKPFLKIADFEKLSEEQIEMLEKSEYITKEIFSLWVRFEEISSKIEKDKRIDCKMKGKIKDFTFTRNRLKRTSNKSEPFFCTNVKFAENTGLYFLIKFNQDALRGKLAEILNFLGDKGLGGERTLGCGRFRPRLWEKVCIETPSHSQANCWCSLSLYYPAEKEMKQLQDYLIAYELVQRGGWIDSPYVYRGLRKKRCRMFKEGTIFSEKILGRLVDVGPDKELPHKIWRYGFAFLIPCFQV